MRDEIMETTHVNHHPNVPSPISTEGLGDANCIKHSKHSCASSMSDHPHQLATTASPTAPCQPGESRDNMARHLRPERPLA